MSSYLDDQVNILQSVPYLTLTKKTEIIKFILSTV